MLAQYLKLIKITLAISLSKTNVEKRSNQKEKEKKEKKIYMSLKLCVHRYLPWITSLWDSKTSWPRDQLCGLCTFTYFTCTHTHFHWTGHFQAGELKLLNKSPLGSQILKDCIEWTNLETKILKSHKHLRYTLCLGDVSLNFRWLKVKCPVEAGRLGSSTANERHKHLQKVIHHFVSVRIKSYPNCQ